MKTFRTLVYWSCSSLMFAVLFYREGAGINYLITLMMGVWLTYVASDADVRPRILPAYLVPGLCALSLSLYGGVFLSEPLFWMSWLAAPVYVLAGPLFAPTLLGHGVYSQIVAPILLAYRTIAGLIGQDTRRGNRVKAAILYALAATVFIVFAILYLQTSEVLAHLVATIDFLALLDWPFILMAVLGSILMAARLAPSVIRPLVDLEQMLPLEVTGTQSDAPTLALEAKVARALLVALIGAALLPALTDVLTLARLLPVPAQVLISDDLHQSVGLLITCCLLVAALAGALFRYKEQNASPLTGNQRMFLAFLAANVLLAGVALIKNLIYVEQMGLTFKRLGVYVWLALVVAGLALTLVKVVRARSFYWLVRAGSYAAILTLACYHTLPSDYWVRASQMGRAKPDFEYLIDNLSFVEQVYVRQSPRFVASPYYARNAEHFKSSAPSYTYPFERHNWQGTYLAFTLVERQGGK